MKENVSCVGVKWEYTLMGQIKRHVSMGIKTEQVQTHH